MNSAQPEKKSRVNQSISADTLRRKVGSAKAASVARAGRPSSSERSDDPVNSVLNSTTSTSHSGTATWRAVSCSRQRHSVHSASGQAGQVNHTSSFSRLRHSAAAEAPGCAPGQARRQWS